MLNRNNKIMLDVSGFSARDTLAETMEMYQSVKRYDWASANLEFIYPTIKIMLAFLRKSRPLWAFKQKSTNIYGKCRGDKL